MPTSLYVHLSSPGTTFGPVHQLGYIPHLDALTTLVTPQNGRDIKTPSPLLHTAKIFKIRNLHYLVDAGLPATNCMFSLLNSLWESVLTNTVSLFSSILMDFWVCFNDPSRLLAIVHRSRQSIDALLFDSTAIGSLHSSQIEHAPMWLTRWGTMKRK